MEARSPASASCSRGWIIIFFDSVHYGGLGGKGVILGSHFATGKVTHIKGKDRQVFGVDLGAVHSVSMGQIGTVKPVEGHGGNLVEFLLQFGDWMFLFLIPFHLGSSHYASIIEPVEGRRAIFILPLLHQVMYLTVGNTLVFAWVCEDDLAIGAVLVQEEESFGCPFDLIG